MLTTFLQHSAAELTHNTATFVPTISAVAVGDIDDHDGLYAKIEGGPRELHDFLCASTNEGHTTMTRELGEWIVTKLKES